MKPTKNRTAIAFSTKDRVALSRQSIKPLLTSKFDLLVFDGSDTDEGKKLPVEFGVPEANVYGSRGGSGPAIVCALTTMLAHPRNYAAIGLVENDVALQENWFEPTMELFELGEKDGLKVGAVSARSYVDRILIQRPNYAIMHNIGAGQVIFSREAAELILNTYRTMWTSDNRKVFNTLTGIDLASFWAFKGNENFLCADWSWDAILAANGFASLALTPAKCQMIGQIPSLEQQGLKLVDYTSHWSDLPVGPFERYRDTLARINDSTFKLPDLRYHREANGTTTYFAHQVASLGATYEGEWRLRDSIGYGPFGWKAAPAEEPSKVTIPVLGPCDFLITGGAQGGRATIVDSGSGYTSSPDLPSEAQGASMLFASVPGNGYRTITLTMTVPGQTFFGVRCRDQQPVNPSVKFDYNTLPKV